jgi:hypothetical protein
MEIGVLNGDNAKTMIQTAIQHVAPVDVEYYGFDFFHRSRFIEVQSKLTQLGCTVNLFKGDSNITLPNVLHTLPKMDVIFIDGGKTRFEAASDWDASQTLMHDHTAVFVHNYEFEGVRWLVDHISREAFQVTILYPPGDAATARITKARD